MILEESVLRRKTKTSLCPAELEIIFVLERFKLRTAVPEVAVKDGQTTLSRLFARYPQTLDMGLLA